MCNLIASLIQLNSQDDIAANISSIGVLVRRAVSEGAQLVCLPENTFYMREPGSGQYPDVTDGIRICSELAREFKIWILIGSMQILAPSGKFYNRSILIDSDGKIAAQYDKIHLFDVTLKNGETYNESARIEYGDKAVLVQTPWGKLGMTICYDLRFPPLYRALARTGADFITIPSAFTHTTGKAHWHALMRARAIETGCYILAPAQCGYHPGNRHTYGHSLIVSPWGEILAEAGEDNIDVITLSLDMDKVNEVRSMIPSLKHDRGFNVVSYV